MGRTTVHTLTAFSADPMCQPLQKPSEYHCDKSTCAAELFGRATRLLDWRFCFFLSLIRKSAKHQLSCILNFVTYLYFLKYKCTYHNKWGFQKRPAHKKTLAAKIILVGKQRWLCFAKYSNLHKNCSLQVEPVELVEIRQGFVTWRYCQQIQLVACSRYFRQPISFWAQRTEQTQFVRLLSKESTRKKWAPLLGNPRFLLNNFYGSESRTYHQSHSCYELLGSRIVAK